jgi:hypothetical protein
VRRSRPFRAIGLGAAAVVLAWLVISKSLVAYLAASAPEAALRLHAGDAEALLSLAQRHLGTVRIGAAGKPAAALPAPPSPREKIDAPGQPGEPLRLWSELAKDVTQAREGQDRKEPPPSPETPSSSPAAQALREEVRIWAETALGNDPINARALRILGEVAQAAGDEGRALSYTQAAARRSIQESLAVDWLMRHHHQKKDYAAALFLPMCSATRRARWSAAPGPGQHGRDPAGERRA